MQRIIVIGSVNRDHLYSVPHIVRPGETIASESYRTGWGGKGLNQAIALAKAGAQVSLIAKSAMRIIHLSPPSAPRILSISLSFIPVRFPPATRLSSWIPLAKTVSLSTPAPTAPLPNTIFSRF